MSQIDRYGGLIGGIAIKAPCKVATTANITLSGAQTVDGVLLTADASPRQRVLVKDQTTASENGIYDVNSGTWTRSPDFDGARDIVRGTIVSVTEGHAGVYEVMTDDPITIGTTSLTFALSSTPGLGIDTIYEISDYSNNLATAVAAIGANSATLLIDRAITENTAVTLPATLTLWFVSPGKINGTGTLAFPGSPDSQIKALPGQQIFGSTVTVTFGKTGTVYSEWWGQNVTPGTTDMTDEIKAAYGSITGGVVRIIGRQKFTAALTIPAGVTIQGDGAADATPAFCPVRPSGLLKTGNFTGVTLSRNSVLRDISVDGDTGNGGIGVLFSGRGILDNVGVFAQGGDGVVIGDGVGDSNFSSLNNVISGWNGGDGFYFNSDIYNSNAIGGHNLFAWTNTGDGFVIGKAWSIVLTSTYSEGNTGDDYHFLSGALGNTLVSPTSDSVTGTLVFDAGSYNNTIIGNVYGLTGKTLTITDNGFNTFGALSAAGSELVEDGSGDTTDGWEANEHASLGAADGYLVLTRVDGTDQSIYTPLEEFQIIIGRVYKFTGIVKSGTSGNETFIVQCYKNGDTPGWIAEALTTGTSAGTDQTWNFTWKATANNIGLYLIKNSATAGTMLWSDISVKEVAIAADSDAWVNGDIWSAPAGKGIVMRNAADTVIKRVRLNDTGDGLIYEKP